MTQPPYLVMATLSLTLLATSCVPSYRCIYRENMATLPGLTEKGDGVISGNYSISGDNESDGFGPSMNSLDLQGAYALSDQWSVLGSISGGWASYKGSGNSFTPYDSCTLNYKNFNWTLGVQYMLHMHRRLYFAPSIGIGGAVFGINDNEFLGLSGAGTNYTLNNRVLQGYFQPAFYIKGSYIDGGFGLRVSFNNFAHVNTNYTQTDEPATNVLNLQNTTLSSAQVFGLIRCYPGIRGVALQMQFGNAVSLNDSSVSKHIRWYSFNFSLGISVSPYQLFRKKRFN